VKKWIVLLMALLAVSLGAQTYFDSPQVAAKDTMRIAMRIVRDFYFNQENNFYTGKRLQGPIDLDIKPLSLTGGHTLIIEVYGILRKSVAGGTTYTTAYVDSHRVASISANGVWHAIPIEPLWTNFPIFDGLHFVFKKTGGETDADSLYTTIRVLPQGGGRW
jgi:hypothetical protein